MNRQNYLNFLALALVATLAWPALPSFADSVYKNKRASRDGTGKFYMGREIAQVMGHLGAGWHIGTHAIVGGHACQMHARLPLNFNFGATHFIGHLAHVHAGHHALVDAGFIAHGTRHRSRRG